MILNEDSSIDFEFKMNIFSLKKIFNTNAIFSELHHMHHILIKLYSR